MDGSTSPRVPWHLERIRVGKANYAMAAGFGIVPGMENENGMSRRPRRRFSAEEKARIVGLYEESGLTRGEFCRREGVEPLQSSALAWEAQGGPEKRVLWRLRLGPLRSRADIGWDLEEERGWKCQGGFDEREVRVLAGIVREAARC